MDRWLAAVTGLLPLIFMLIPKLPSVLVPVIIQGIQEAEQIKGATGAQKKDHVMALVHLAIETINTAKKREVIGAEALATIDRAVDTGIAMVNLFTRRHA